MKKKITLLALMLVLMTTLMVLFAFTASAEDGITVTYHNNYKINVNATATPNEDGTYTLRTQKISGDGTVTLADGTVVNKVFYGWFTQDGTLYAPGETVTFTESTQLFEAYGVEVSTPEDLEAVKINNYVRIGADMTIDFELKSDWGCSIYDLNGHTITSTNNKHAIYNYRGATILVGKGKLIHQPATINTNDSQTGGIIYHHHGHGDWDTLQRCWIGKDVEFTTPYNFIRITNSPNYDKTPDVDIYGSVTAKNFIRAGILTGASVVFHEGANVTLTGTSFYDCTNTTSVDPYMDITLGGTIKLTDPNARILTDFLMTNKFNVFEITNGSFTVSSTDAERISMFLPNTLMLKPTSNEDGTTTYNVAEADCIHDWVKDMEASIEAIPGTTGIDVFSCSKCGQGKQAITVYSPKNVEITVTIKTDEGEKVYTVLAGDVFDLQFSGIGATALCYIAGLKDTVEFTADQIVAFDIPAGVDEFYGFANATVEAVNLLDGAIINLYSLTQMTALKTINVGAATVTFDSLAKSYIETISSKVAGATLTFNKSCFSSSTNIKNIEMCAGSKYSFGESSFNTTTLTEIVFPDNSTISWGKNAFQGSNLKYIYIGSNIGITQIANESAVFDNLLDLEKVVIMDLTLIGKWTLSLGDKISPNAPVLTIYCHSSNVSITSEAFNNKNGGRHINFYTIDPDIVNLGANVSSYTIYSGIAHAYTQDIITESTCIEQGTAGYVTDCPCGNDYRENAYTTYSTDSTLNNVAHEAFGTEVVYLPLSNEHVMGELLADIVYTNYFENGTKYFYCAVCNTATLAEEAPSATPLFIAVGYSTDETNGKGVSHTIKVNRGAVELYKSIGHDFYFGVVAGIYTDGTPITGIDSTKQNIIMADMSKNSFDRIQIKISGIDDDKIETALVCCAYAIENAAEPVIKYLSGNETLDEVESIAYDAILALPPVQESKEN